MENKKTFRTIGALVLSGTMLFNSAFGYVSRALGVEPSGETTRTEQTTEYRLKGNDNIESFVKNTIMIEEYKETKDLSGISVDSYMGAILNQGLLPYLEEGDVSEMYLDENLDATGNGRLIFVSESGAPISPMPVSPVYFPAIRQGIIEYAKKALAQNQKLDPDEAIKDPKFVAKVEQDLLDSVEETRTNESVKTRQALLKEYNEALARAEPVMYKGGTAEEPGKGSTKHRILKLDGEGKLYTDKAKTQLNTDYRQDVISLEDLADAEKLIATKPNPNNMSDEVLQENIILLNGSHDASDTVNKISAGAIGGVLGGLYFLTRDGGSTPGTPVEQVDEPQGEDDQEFPDNTGEGISDDEDRTTLEEEIGF